MNLSSQRYKCWRGEFDPQQVATVTGVSIILGVSAHFLLREITHEQRNYVPRKRSYSCVLIVTRIVLKPSTPERAQVRALQRVSQWWTCRKLAYDRPSHSLFRSQKPTNETQPLNHPHIEYRPYPPWVHLPLSMIRQVVSPRVNPKNLSFPGPRQP